MVLSEEMTLNLLSRSSPPPGALGPVPTIRVRPWGAALLLQHPRGDGVGPESLGGPVLGLDLLGFWGRVWVAGIEHGLQDAPPGIDEPGGEKRLPGQLPFG